VAAGLRATQDGLCARTLARWRLIDLHESEAALMEYIRRHIALDGPSTPVLRDAVARSGARTPAEEDEVIRRHTPWMNPADYGLDEAERRDRAVGAMLGLAIGDAVGTTLEFRRRDEARVQDMVGGGPFGLAPGEWTDDTSMALCLGYSLAELGRLDPDDVARRLVAWYRQGAYSMNGRCFDIGGTTRRAVEGYERAGFRWGSNTGPDTNGNGSLVRTAPLATFRRRSLRQTCRDAASQSAITHGAVEAKACCQLFAVQMHHALNGASREQALARHRISVSARPTLINAGSYKAKGRDHIRSSGYVVDTLEAALWSVWTTESFEAAVLTAANLADDADSVACAAGQLAGALYGAKAIPLRWRERVAWSDRLADVALALFDRAPAEDVPA
jgi:ADP-ribosyl-[dinitrogen reductase] hydrolase